MEDSCVHFATSYSERGERPFVCQEQGGKVGLTTIDESISTRKKLFLGHQRRLLPVPVI